MGRECFGLARAAAAGAGTAVGRVAVGRVVGLLVVFPTVVAVGLAVALGVIAAESRALGAYPPVVAGAVATGPGAEVGVTDGGDGLGVAAPGPWAPVAPDPRDGLDGVPACFGGWAI